MQDKSPAAQLQRLQQAFIKGVMQQPSEHSDTTDLDWISPHARLSAVDQLAIYRNSTTAIILEGLLNVFSACERLVGKDFMTGLLRAFMRAHPCDCADLTHYAWRVSDFIETFAHAKAIPYLADMARLDFAVDYAYHGPDWMPLDLSRLQGVAPERILFRLPGCATLLKSPYPIKAIWAQCQPNAQPQNTINLDAGPCQLIVWRKSEQVRLHDLPTPLYTLLALIRQGLPLQAVCEKLAKQGIEVGSLLPLCIERGYIADFIVIHTTV